MALALRNLLTATLKSREFSTRFHNADRDVKSVHINDTRQYYYYKPKTQSPGGQPMALRPKVDTTFIIKVTTINGYVVELHLHKLHVNSHAKIRCSCPDFKYRFHAVLWRYGASFGRIQSKTKAYPKIRNPKGEIAICKHAIGAIRFLVDAGTIGISDTLTGR